MQNNRLIAVFLGALGIINSVSMGFYIVSVCLSSVIKLNFYGYIAAFLTTLTVLMLTYGSYLLWNNKSSKGAIMNLTAGLISSFLYLYYNFGLRPQLLSWLGSAGVFLPLPSVLSGIIALSFIKETS
jgi:hypothetical protein